ncbi:GTP cyclohydrolase II [Thoreauomyces humboldtii]|nr:GTP cyclohydrolase II [Thoreauomyces humboldtii]
MLPHAPTPIHHHHHLHSTRFTEQGSPLLPPAHNGRTPSPTTSPFFIDHAPSPSTSNGHHNTSHHSTPSHHHLTSTSLTSTSRPASPLSKPSTPTTPLEVRCHVRTRIPSEFGGQCYVHLYSNTWDDEEHLALVYGDEIVSESLERHHPGDTDRERMLRGCKDVAGTGTGTTQPRKEEERRAPDAEAKADDANAKEADDMADADAKAPLVRIHSCCFTGETIRSMRCDCAEQLEEAMRRMAEVDGGVVLYLKQEGRGIGLRDKLRAYNLIDLGHDTMAANLLLGHPPDARSYEIASAMLRDLGIPVVRLLTNNPDKMNHLQRDGVRVSERVPMVPASWSKEAQARLGSTAIAAIAAIDTGAEGRTASKKKNHVDRDEYLVTKVQRMGHILDIPKHLLEGINNSNGRENADGKGKENGKFLTNGVS